jgi:hypothetical protein
VRPFSFGGRDLKSTALDFVPGDSVNKRGKWNCLFREAQKPGGRAMKSKKKLGPVLAISLLSFLFAACGNVEDVVISCADLEPCVGISCQGCGWPAGSCSMADGILASATVSDSGRAPFFILIDIEVLSETQEQEEEACVNGEIVIANEDGDLLRRNLALDQPVSLCTTSPSAGLHTVSLLCEGFPTRGRYQLSIADSNGTGMWP